MCTDGGEESDVTDGEDGNVEPTQAYHFGVDGAEEEEDEGGEPMDCDATVAYNMSGKKQPCTHT